MKLEDLNLLDVGHTIQLAGALYADGKRVYLVPLPDELTDYEQKAVAAAGPAVGARYMGKESPLQVLDMDRDDWARFIRQTDLLETEIMAHAEENGTRKLVKALVRKSQRQISQGVSWQVFKRDGYHCRYCGAEGVPMTVDHVVTWEQGGPSIVENLVTACRKCNKIRGNTEYADWLRHPHYKKVSRGLPIVIVERNEAVLHTLAAIPRMVHKPSKR